MSFAEHQRALRECDGKLSVDQYTAWFNYWLSVPVSRREQVIIMETLRAHPEDVRRIAAREAARGG